VLVQTISSEDETRDFLRVAETTDFVLGVVGWVDLTADDVGDRLDALAEADGGSWLVGIRHQVHDEPDERWLNRPDVRGGLRALVERNLSYDLLLRAREIPAAVATVRAVPELRFVVDHIGKPTIAAGQDAAWASGMAQLSELPNVSVKLSGMITEADWAAWAPNDLRPFVEQVRDWFGSARLMAGSDWPVCLLAADSYTQVFDATSATLDGLSDDEVQDVFGFNAEAFYGLAAREEEVAP
jgi:L-fuconolactonase